MSSLLRRLRKGLRQSASLRGELILVPKAYAEHITLSAGFAEPLGGDQKGAA